jgi:hypothetical protein
VVSALHAIWAACWQVTLADPRFALLVLMILGEHTTQAIEQAKLADRYWRFYGTE